MTLSKYRPRKSIIQFQIELEIPLYSKFEPFNSTVVIKKYISI